MDKKEANLMKLEKQEMGKIIKYHAFFLSRQYIVATMCQRPTVFLESWHTTMGNKAEVDPDASEQINLCQEATGVVAIHSFAMCVGL